MTRRYTKTINVGNVKIGGDSPIVVQSMTNTDTRDVLSTVSQIKLLEDAGCEIIRVAVPDEEASSKLKDIRKNINIPLIADIHFDYKLAINSIINGADCVRINPGNIGGFEKLRKVAEVAKDYNVSLRIGVNSGSLEKDLLKSYGISVKSIVVSALRSVEFLESIGFTNFKVSLKASSVPLTIDSYRAFSKLTSYPLHIGVTEAGTTFAGAIKSAIGIGTLLSEGIGDTLRVSLTGDPIKEVEVAYEILKSLNLRNNGPEFISCPTCGRTEINLEELAVEVEKKLKHIKDNITIAVMGCPVNGPGEARGADYGIAGGKGVGLIFKKGKILKKVKSEHILDEFLKVLKEDNIL
ncbi:MAG: flavodoxin-dependent (E)-4-hydroxy-3-methylbut-2-enyl-diphosphate synthase [Deferribacterales bacterium]|uniref:flavodoxin-dependent (E)-4-hydroxy-3-methylbut-2-enyl-diphosphate synthase n=1 Tax=Deferrivibrio essentukiensis TaxID=2880922 RepID=UPI0019CB4896|nr:flavodoxin-dependent (E)-4-hydroxy-3-methylbut-2-enyl-diphosphate synthase [Deferrivibrio essentukiensis]MBC7195740.1 flavodoxin-dependent (E)-4-hydroxy-3-methylbut-2-enyl-diphosphate synthase [Deferribacterales bacterium]MCB4205348.1 flavodoxin-dependent (E)-4-hydroxy-3-methylbut-2-enyl-diphosphate synthase [Deferrivibrio essentukiensis]